MKTYSLLKRSIKHSNHNEDFIFSFQLNDELTLCAVMDGCSSGCDSHFVSALYAKSIDKSGRVLPQMKEIIEDFNMENMEPDSIAEFVLNQLFDDLKKMKRLLFLKTEELLTTLLLLVYNQKTQQAAIYASGDGIFAVNGQITEIDQLNMPNFLGYHLNKNFEDALKEDIQKWTFTEVKDVSIATDGIDKLRKDFNNSKELRLLRQSFLTDQPLSTEHDFFESKFEEFSKKGFKPYDDIGMIRIINNP